jgi:hypothetical protein
MGCSTTTKVQSVLMPRAAFTPSAARRWLRSHGYRTALDCTANYCRARQLSPRAFCRGTLRTITFGRGIKAVVGKRRG